MANETDPCLWKWRKKKQTHKHSSESDDEPYGFDAKYLTGHNSTPKDQRTNESHRKTDVSLAYAPGIFPYYYHREPIRGSAIFVVNQTFQSDVIPKCQSDDDYRHGADMDLSYLKFVFLDKLGFEQLNIDNDSDLGKSKFDDVLDKATSKDYSDTDFFVFAISTHGEERPRRSQQFEHALLCADYTYKYTMDVIKRLGSCPTLAGKPKIFVIQACRSRSDSNPDDPNKFDKGLDFALMSKKEEKDSKPKRNCSYQTGNFDSQLREKYSAEVNDKADANNEVDIKEEANIEDKEGTKTNEKNETCTKAGEREKANEKDNTDAEANTKDEADAGHKNDDYQKRAESGFGSETVISLNNIPKDCLVVYAIQSGKYAWRHSETGSWLLYELKKVLKEYTYPCSIPFLDILTNTAFKMAQRKSSEGEFKAVPVIQHRLTKNILIPLKQRQTYV